MKHLALLLVILAACNEPTKKPPPTVEPSREGCATALESFDKFVDTGEADPAQSAKVKAAALERCITDRWSAAALACMRAAGTSHDTFACWNEQLTKPQRDAVSSAIGKLAP
jgi:hypothetical protein